MVKYKLLNLNVNININNNGSITHPFQFSRLSNCYSFLALCTQKMNFGFIRYI